MEFIESNPFIFGLGSLFVYVIFSIALFVISNKLGLDMAWLSFVPIANAYQLTRCAGVNPLWLIGVLIPCVNLFVMVYLWWQVGERRGKPGILSLLLIVPIVGWFVPLYYAFSD